VVLRRNVRYHSYLLYCTGNVEQAQESQNHLISSSCVPLPSMSFLSSLLFLLSSYPFSFITINLSFLPFLFLRLSVHSLFSPLCFHSPIGHFSLVAPHLKSLFRPFHNPLSTLLELFQSNLNNNFKQKESREGMNSDIKNSSENNHEVFRNLQ
jgi:hypothetical protein